MDMRVSRLKDAPNARAVHSSKAVGEPPFFLAASVLFALRRAVAEAEECRAYHDGGFGGGTFEPGSEAAEDLLDFVASVPDSNGRRHGVTDGSLQPKAEQASAASGEEGEEAAAGQPLTFSASMLRVHRYNHAADYPPHEDLGLLTVAPRASLAALRRFEPRSSRRN